MSEPSPVLAPAPQQPAPVALLSIERCPSCGEAVRGRFCSGCGQSHADVRVPFGKWLRDYIDDSFHLDSNLSRSVGALLRRPGALTLAYLEGQRSAYVRPFRLYLTASFLYFLALSLVPASRDFVEVKTEQGASGGVTVSVGPSLAEVSTDSEADAPHRPKLHEDSEFKRRLNRFVANGPQAARELAVHSMTRTMPKAMFVLVPVFALLLGWLYRKTGRFYAEHFLFALHFHAFAFLALAAGLILTALLGLGRVPVMQLLIVSYLFLSLRRVYGQPGVRTAFKTAVLYGSYGFLLLLTVLGTMMASIYFGD